MLFFTQNFNEIVLGEPLCQRGPWGFNAKMVAKYSDIGPVENHISEMVQDTASETGDNIRGIQPKAPLLFGP